MNTKLINTSIELPRKHPRSAFILFALACFALLPSMQAVVPAPDGGYPGGNTAEGESALLHLSDGSYNTAVGWASLGYNMAGDLNTGIGAGALLANTSDQNTAIGAGALLSNTTGHANTANGAFALFNNAGGNVNTATGASALEGNTTGSGNTANGVNALGFNTTGSNNIALGVNAGVNLSTGNNNIDIGHTGFVPDADTIRIGTSGFQTSTFISGIRGVTTGNMDAIPVLIDTQGQLGTISSSRRYKKQIKPMGSASEAILALKPVTFYYKSDNKDTPQFGLIAEEVAEVNPALIVPDKEGQPYTVRYDAVNAMLLNEFLKEHRTVQELKKQIAALTATVKEQSAQIQTVSAQVEPKRSAAQMVVNFR